MDPGIVGRAHELTTASSFLGGLPEGAGGLLVEGDAGIGKTAVWRAVVAEAIARGYRVLTCAGDQAEARLSFVGLADLVGDAVDEASSLPAPQRGALEQALQRREGVRTVDASAIGAAVRALLAASSAAAPVLIAVDDVQWLDGATAAALAFATRRLDGLRVGVVATVRAPLSSADPLGLERALSARRFSRFRLGPLSPGELRALIESRLGHRYGRSVLLRIAQASGGNPLFALELARALGPEPSLEAGAPLPVPESLRELAGARVALVQTEGKEALLAAAALSRPTVQLVERVASAAGLAAAEEAGLLRVERDRILFAHPLYASAVYTAAPSGRRRELHRRLSALVADPEEQARHLALAATPPDDGVAAALETAAAHARARGAWDAAGELLELASAFTWPGGAGAARVRTIRAAEHYIHAGDRTRARALLESALAETPSGSIRADALRLLAEVHHNEDSFAEAASLLEEALEHAHDAPLRVSVHVAAAYVAFNRGALDRADRHAEAAISGAAALGDDAVLAEALGIRVIVDYIIGRGVDWQRVDRALELEDRTRIVPVTMRPSAIDAALTLFVGRLTEAREKLNVLRRAASDSGDDSDLAIVLFWLSWLEADAGNLDAAARLADEGVAHAVATGSASGHAYLLGQRAVVHALRGEVDEARAAAAEAVRVCASVGFWQPMLWVASALGLLELSLGDHAAAWAAVREPTEAAETVPVREPHVHQYVPAAIEALIGMRELERAERLLGWFEELGRRVDRRWALAVAARGRGQLLAARGDLEGAGRALEDAVARFEELEMQFELARTLLVQGQVRRRRRQKRAAREPLEQALALFESQGASLWAARARDELARTRSSGGDGPLTAAEARVAKLAAAGNSNKQIAATLFLSVHTVELHLSHAYAKLGIRSRSQLAHHLQ